MHRKQAGEPDETGWMLAESTEGRFSVRMPINFNDFTVVETNPNAPAERTHTSRRPLERAGSRWWRRASSTARGRGGARSISPASRRARASAASRSACAAQGRARLRAVDFVLEAARPRWPYQRAVLLGSEVMMLTRRSAARARRGPRSQLAAGVLRIAAGRTPSDGAPCAGCCCIALSLPRSAAAQKQRFELDLGLVDIERVGHREYKLPPLPEADIAFGFKLTAPDGEKAAPPAQGDGAHHAGERARPGGIRRVRRAGQFHARGVDQAMVPLPARRREPGAGARRRLGNLCAPAQGRAATA